MVGRGRRALACVAAAGALTSAALAVPSVAQPTVDQPTADQPVRGAKPARTLTLDPAQPVAGERARLRGRAPGSAKREVRLQVQRADGSWRSVDRRTTRSDRTFTFRLAAAATTARRLRVIAPGVDGAPVHRFRAVSYAGRDRTVRLVVPTEARAGETVVATALVDPPRPGRPVQLLLGDQVVDAATQDPLGRAVLEVVAPGPGFHGLSALAPAGAGVAATTSGVETLRTTPALTGVPRVDIVTDDGEPITSKETYKRATVSVDPRGSGVPAYAASARLRVRGNFTANAAEKLPYRLKLDTSEPLVGLPRSKDWVLLANYFDTSLLRTTLGMEAGRRLGLPWSPRFVDAEVWLNGVFKGLYQLGEGIEVDEDRVDIELADEDDVPTSGGFLLEADSYDDSDPRFTTSRGLQVYVKEPGDAEDDFVDEVAAQIETLEDVLYSPGLADPATGYPALIDVDSFVDWYLVMELLKTVDAGMLNSVHLQRDLGGRLAMGPVWDFDISAGNRKRWSITSPTGWYLRRNFAGDPEGVPSQLFGPQGHWFVRLFTDPAFEDAVRARWSEVRASVGTLPAFLGARRASIAAAADRNFAPTADGGAGMPVDAPTPDLDSFYVYFGTWAESVDYLEDWLADRIAWMDAELS